VAATTTSTGELSGYDFLPLTICWIMFTKPPDYHFEPQPDN
jgi:hypothetical protein